MFSLQNSLVVWVHVLVACPFWLAAVLTASKELLLLLDPQHWFNQALLLLAILSVLVLHHLSQHSTDFHIRLMLLLGQRPSILVLSPCPLKMPQRISESLRFSMHRILVFTSSIIHFFSVLHRSLCIRARLLSPQQREVRFRLK
jgi:hypothetical protein